MQEKGVILNYTGPIDYDKIDSLLQGLKSSNEYNRLQKTTGKRLYAILVECLENIARHSAKNFPGSSGFQSFISIEQKGDKITVRAGNPIDVDEVEQLVNKLDRINQMGRDVLITTYEKMINKETREDENGAGLGFIIMRIKSGNKIDYTIDKVNSGFYNFKIMISINKSAMRKLIIDQTTNSPGVVLDPESNRFEITGESRPPDVGNFYGEILRWMDDYSQHVIRSHEEKDPVEFNFDLEYFNSSSAKYILDFCKQIATIPSKGKNVIIKWHYEAEDMDMLEVGKELSRLAKFPFEFIKKS
jgi:hypothetical protein